MASTSNNNASTIPSLSSSSISSASTNTSSEPLDSCPLKAFNEVKAMKGGVLIKQGEHVKNWKSRLFLLEGHFLYYFVTELDSIPRGVIDLQQCYVQQEESKKMSHCQYCFSILSSQSWNVSQKKKFQQRTYYLCTDSFTDMSDWINLLNNTAKWYQSSLS